MNRLLLAGVGIVALACRDSGPYGKPGTTDTAHRPDDTASDTGPPGLGDTATDTGTPEALPGLDARPGNPTCVAGPRPVDPDASIALEPSWEELTFGQPTHLARLPGSDTWCVSQLKTAVECFEAADPVGTRTTVLSVPDLADITHTEWGVLGFAVHPDFPTDRRVFVLHTAPGTGAATLSALTIDADGHWDPTTARALLSVPQADDTSSHIGGLPVFHPRTGHLYLGLGDGGTADAPDRYEGARDPTQLYGKVLRIDVNEGASSLEVAGADYRVPADNPHADGVDGRPEVYAMGLRNPWRMSFDPETADLWVGDVGHACWEELNRVQLGGDYGWPLREGAHPFDLTAWDRYNDEDGCDPDPGVIPGGVVEPVWEYGQDGDSQSVTGGVVYRGSQIPELVGHYVFADFRSGKLWALPPDPGPGDTATLLLDSDDRIVSFTTDADGELLVLAYSFWTGVVRRVVPVPDDDGGDDTGAPATDDDDVPALLSETGCFDPTDPTVPLPGLIPYDVAHPLWSDGATKRRWLALPDDRTIHVAADGTWILPEGSVLVKEFSVDGRRVETRLLSKHDDGSWTGTTYAWTDDQADAERVVGGAVVPLDGIDSGVWAYPSGNACLSCHTESPTRVLGFRAEQLDTTRTWSTGREAHQLYTLDHIGLFDPPLGATADGVDGLVGLAGRDGPPGDAARAWLSVNCAACHQPGGTARSELDLRHTTPLADTGACDTLPVAGTLGLDDARLIAPGAPERSVLLERVKVLDAYRMPPLASHVVDEEGVALLEAWIRSLDGCEE